MATLNLHAAPRTDGTTNADGDALAAPQQAVRRSRSGGRHAVLRSRSRGAYALSAASLGALIAAVVMAGAPATASSPELTTSSSVADALGIDGTRADAPTAGDREHLEALAASRAQRDADQAAAAASQAQAEEAAAAARAEAEARAAAEAAAAAAAEAEAAAAAQAAASTAVTAVAQIKNSAGPVRPVVQAAANAVVSNVPGADRITLGGTRASASDPGGHPSGLALDYMVMSDAALGDAIVEYHIAHWDELGVDYIIWQQRMLSSPGGSWKMMENRGDATANHMDHPHVNYRG